MRHENFLLEKIAELCKGCNLWLKIHAFHKMTVVSLIPFRLGYVGKKTGRREWGQMSLPVSPLFVAQLRSNVT